MNHPACPELKTAANRTLEAVKVNKGYKVPVCCYPVRTDDDGAPLVTDDGYESPIYGRTPAAQYMLTQLPRDLRLAVAPVIAEFVDAFTSAAGLAAEEMRKTAVNTRKTKYRRTR